HELMRRQITAMVEDVVRHALDRIALLRPTSVEDVRAAGRRLVAFSEAMAEREGELKRFLFHRLYRHPQVLAVREQAERGVRALFDAYMGDPWLLPENWRCGLEHAGKEGQARRIADFLAGMTDTYALKEYGRLFDRTVQLS